jgi:hypothetical protein
VARSLRGRRLGGGEGREVADAVGDQLRDLLRRCVSGVDGHEWVAASGQVGAGLVVEVGFDAAASDAPLEAAVRAAPFDACG